MKADKTNNQLIPDIKVDEKGYMNEAMKEKAREIFEKRKSSQEKLPSVNDTKNKH